MLLNHRCRASLSVQLRLVVHFSWVAIGNKVYVVRIKSVSKATDISH